MNYNVSSPEGRPPVFSFKFKVTPLQAAYLRGEVTEDAEFEVIDPKLLEAPTIRDHADDGATNGNVDPG